MEENLDYRRAGVDIEAGEQAVQRIKKHAGATWRPEVLSSLGGFSGLFAPDLKGIKEPVLVAGCDGVGTKLKIAFSLNRHDTIGIDCVAMCVNDILVQGAEPLFFLDYLAVGVLNKKQAEEIVSGVAKGCLLAGCALLGGETAEMPGFYPPGEYDLAGFAVGLADKSKLIDGSEIKPGDVLIGLASSGLHSNGFSLVRRVLPETDQALLKETPPGFKKSLGAEFLEPTKIYVKPVLEALKKFKIKGMAHITGGGITGNLSRILPEGCCALVDSKAWPRPEIFKLIMEKGPVAQEEMYRVFNMGIGFVLVAAAAEAGGLISFFAGHDVLAYQIGAVHKGEKSTRLKF